MTALQSIVESLVEKAPSGRKSRDRAEAEKIAAKHGSVDGAIKALQKGMRQAGTKKPGLGQWDSSGTNQMLRILDELKLLKKIGFKPGSGKNEGRSFDEVTAEEAAAREAFEAGEDDALDDFTAEVQRRARETPVRRGINEGLGMPETPDALFEIVEATIPGSLSELGGGGRRSYGGDPRWMTAKRPGKTKDNTDFKKGDEVLYWPSTKEFMVGKKAKKAWQQFQSEKGDDEGMPYASHTDAPNQPALSEAAATGADRHSVRGPSQEKGLKLLGTTHMKWGTRYNYRHGIFIDHEEAKGVFNVNQAGSPKTKKLGTAKTLKKAKDIALAKGDLTEAAEPTDLDESVFDKPAWIADFKAGWEASKKMKAHVVPKTAYNRGNTSKKHGSSWIEGYGAWIDYKRGATKQAGVQNAKKMGLIKEGETQRHGGLGGLDTPDALFESCLEQGTLSQLDEGTLSQLDEGLGGLHGSKGKGVHDPTVATFLSVLTSKITQADMRSQKAASKQGRTFNHYALGNYFAAMQDRVEKPMKAKLTSSDPADLKKLKALIGKAFSQFSPANYTMKAIDQWLASGKRPKITGRAGSAPAWSSDRKDS